MNPKRGLWFINLYKGNYSSKGKGVYGSYTFKVNYSSKGKLTPILGFVWSPRYEGQKASLLQKADGISPPSRVWLG